MSSVAAAADILVVHPSTAAASVQELIALLKSKPGTPAGHAGIGTTPHLSLETFRRMAGVEVTMVPFKGGGEAQQGILGGQVPFMFSTTIGILPHVRSGQLRALAVSSAKRIAAAPELATVAESGLPGFDVVAWFGLFAPAGTPKPIVDRLSAETRAALGAPDVRKRLIDLGAEPLGSTPEAFAAYVNAEFQRWGRLTREAGISSNRRLTEDHAGADHRGGPRPGADGRGHRAGRSLVPRRRGAGPAPPAHPQPAFPSRRSRAGRCSTSSPASCPART